MSQTDLQELSQFTLGGNLELSSCAVHSSQRPVVVRGLARTLFKPFFFFLNQAPCGFLDFKLESFIKIKLLERLRGKPHLSYTRILADDSGRAEGLLCLNNLATMESACSQPRRSSSPACRCSRRLSKYVFKQEKTLAEWEGEIFLAVPYSRTSCRQVAKFMKASSRDSIW